MVTGCQVPIAVVTSGGSTVEQTSVASGQRVWKRHAAGGSIELGTSPLRITRGRAAFSRGSGTGMADSSACVYESDVG